jgi:hypothetical protein
MKMASSFFASFKKFLVAAIPPWPALLFCATGWLLAFHPMILSGLAQIQTDPGDPRFINYILEYTYHWVRVRPDALNLWNPPFFYPAPNALAYSDLLLTAAPFYWAWRLISFPPDTSFQLWLLTVAALNFFAGYALFNKSFRLGPMAAAVGAFFLAFSSPRISQLHHPQLLIHFFSVGALIALFSAYREQGAGSSKKSALFIAIFYGCAVAQLYSAFYFGWFLALSLAIAVAWMGLLPQFRKQFFSFVRSNAAALTIGGLVSFLLASPLCDHYLKAALQVGVRDYREVHSMVPTLASWFYLGPDSWLYGWLDRLLPIRIPASEHALGVGFLSMALSVIGLIGQRKRLSVGLIALVAATLFVLTTETLSLHLWKYVYGFFPGASAIRSVARVGLMMTLPFSLGMALFVEKGASLKQRPWLAVLLIAAMLEQAHTTPSYDKRAARADVATLVHKINPACETFFYTTTVSERRARELPTTLHTIPNFKFQLDAMWASLDTGIPTINGYSGNVPAGWNLGFITILSPEMERQVGDALRAWIENRFAKKTSVCWIKQPNDQ